MDESEILPDVQKSTSIFLKKDLICQLPWIGQLKNARPNFGKGEINGLF